MKITKKELTEKEVTVDIVCNYCNNSLSDNVGNYEGLVEAYIEGGYNSKYSGDGNMYTFSICEECLYKKVIDNFVIQPTLVS